MSDTVILYRTVSGPVVQQGNAAYSVDDWSWDDLLNVPSLARALESRGERVENVTPLAPIGSQEVWAAGVTYLRSREARREEVKAAGAGDGDFYAKVYEADRPELFLKATAHRVVGHEQDVYIRRDSKWQVPEPELAIVCNARGELIGWTIGNDMSSRDIEGENPLYLPQAKVWDGSCALGPGVVLGPPPPATTAIRLVIRRAAANAFEGATTLAQMKRQPAELAGWLFRECTFPNGVVMLTGTGIVPPDDFTLAPGDEVSISIGEAGTLRNTVAMRQR